MSYSVDRVNKIRGTISSHVKTYFGSTLANEGDIVNVFNALVYLESGFRFDATGPTVSSRAGTTGYGYINSTAVQKVLQSGTPLEKANILKGLNGLGLCQVMGWNFVKGGAPSGKCEIEARRPDLAGTLCVAPGVDLAAWVLGEANVSKSLLAGLVILESKYKAVVLRNRAYSFPSDRYNRQFESRISAAVAGYLGLGAMDKLGTTPQEYARRIVGGSTYQAANSGRIIVSEQVLTAKNGGPATNGTGQSVILPPGC